MSPTNSPGDSQAEPSLQALFQQADKIGKKRYHKLTPQDFEDYRQYDHWRYIGGDSECGSTEASKQWVKDHSDYHCPICEIAFRQPGHHRTIDHKLPRSQYPWLSLNFANLWVICQICNREKGERHWFEYEQYILTHHPDRFENLLPARPNQLIKNLRNDMPQI